MRITKTLAALTLSAALLAGGTTAHAAGYSSIYEAQYAAACTKQFDVWSVYARAAVVVEVDEERETVTAQDAAGYRWSFYSDGAGDWEIGDGVALTMYDNGTPDSILDDWVIGAHYERFDLLPNA